MPVSVQSQMLADRVGSPWEAEKPLQRGVKGGSNPLPAEVETGNVEYKLKLVRLSPSRMEKLITQLQWRLMAGEGTALYEIGVADSGDLIGLALTDMNESVRSLVAMASHLNARVSIRMVIKSDRLNSQGHRHWKHMPQNQIDAFFGAALAVSSAADAPASTDSPAAPWEGDAVFAFDLDIDNLSIHTSFSADDVSLSPTIGRPLLTVPSPPSVARSLPVISGLAMESAVLDRRKKTNNKAASRVRRSSQAMSDISVTPDRSSTSVLEAVKTSVSSNSTSHVSTSGASALSTTLTHGLATPPKATSSSRYIAELVVSHSR